MLAADRFLFLTVEGICSEARHWQGAGHTKLWVYNLHYFDDLNSADAASRRSWHEHLLERWLDENPPGQGVGWEPYPVCRRVVNWMKRGQDGLSLAPRVLQSLVVQTRWLNARLEWHLQGNHLFANAKALVYAGLFFRGAEADGWLHRGLAIVRRELAEQVLADGGHFERSPMYHAAFLEDLLDLTAMMRAHDQPIPGAWVKAVVLMVDWLESMSHPDGDISFFNDAAFGIAPKPLLLRDYAERLCIALKPFVRAALRCLTPSGYMAVNVATTFMICDVAAIGPDHLPAHAHADALSFEMSIGRSRIFVNSGTSEYGDGPERQRQRGTAAHNTVVINGENSSEVWAGFRVARRSRSRLLQTEETGSSFVVAGEHDGYRRLGGKNIHRRIWTANSDQLVIEDRVEGPFRSAKCFFHLHPHVDVSHQARELRLFDSTGNALVMSFDGASAVEVRPSTWHPQFGVSIANRCIIAVIEDRVLKTCIRWRGAS
jgi:uncharacterized heparinase superfamily protein